jgi:PTH2 family peptidyl-tRNA hydrolase
MYKQIIIARKDLNMSPGKLAAQVSHGSIAFLTWEIRNNAFPCCEERKLASFNKPTSYNAILHIDKDLYEQWINGEFTKCVLQAKNKNQLLKAKTMAEEIGMVEGKDFWLIRDNCHTELEPEEDGRTLTVIGFKPMDSEIIDKIGKKYHLYM